MDAELVALKEQIGACADSQLMAGLQKLVRIDRRCEARMLMYLAEVDARRLFLAEGYSSLFGFATTVLRMSDAQAGLRIQISRLARRLPVIFEMLVRGEVNLSTLKLLDRHLTADNHLALLERARNKTKCQVELLIAEVAPQPDVPNQIRKVPDPKPSRRTNADRAQVQTPLLAPHAETEQAPIAPDVDMTHVAAAAVRAEVRKHVPQAFVLEAPRASCTALRPGRFKLDITAGQTLHDKLKQLQHLLRHQVPGGNLAVIVERALDVLLERTLKQRFAQVSKPRASGGKSGASRKIEQGVAAASHVDAHDKAGGRSAHSLEPTQPSARTETGLEHRRKSRGRYIPRAVVREVFARDGGQCTFVSANGQRCSERGMLELHHVHAFALGGDATVQNLKLVCRGHNGFFADQDFGAAHMQMKRASSRVRQHQPVLF